MAGNKTFKIHGVDKALPFVAFTIGGASYDVPKFNLTAARAMQRGLAAAKEKRGGDQLSLDEILEQYIAGLSSRMASVDGSPLTAGFIADEMLGQDELDAFWISMSELLEISGYLKKDADPPGEEEAAPEIEASPK